MKNKAFTLIELLVVIAIISILATILLPSLSQAQSLAKRASCMSRQKGIGVVINMYANEYQGACPTRMLNTYQHSFWICNNATPTYLGLLRAAGLVEDRTLLYCPDMGTTPYMERYSTQVSEADFGVATELGTYVMQASDPNNPNDPMQKPLLDDLLGQPIVACGNSGSSLFPHGGDGTSLLWAEGSVSWWEDGGLYENIWIMNRYTGRFWDLAARSR